MPFQDSLTMVLRFEGGYTVDSGGPTNYGITQSTYNDFRFKSVREISPVEVATIYQKMYWIASRADILDVIDPMMAEIHFDCAVNCGVGTACRLLQRSLKVQEDGVIGAITLTAFRQSLVMNRRETLVNYLNVREAYYRSLTEFPKYGSSWLHRIAVLRSTLLTQDN